MSLSIWRSPVRVRKSNWAVTEARQASMSYQLHIPATAMPAEKCPILRLDILDVRLLSPLLRHSPPRSASLSRLLVQPSSAASKAPFKNGRSQTQITAVPLPTALRRSMKFYPPNVHAGAQMLLSE